MQCSEDGESAASVMGWPLREERGRKVVLVKQPNESFSR